MSYHTIYKFSSIPSDKSNIENQWRNLKSLHNYLSLFSPIGSQVLICSGEGHGGRKLATTELLDLVTGQSWDLPSLPKAKDSATGGLIHSKAYVCGGDDDAGWSDECHSLSGSFWHQVSLYNYSLDKVHKVQMKNANLKGKKLGLRIFTS